jgi:hypothetical protein
VEGAAAPAAVAEGDDDDASTETAKEDAGASTTEDDEGKVETVDGAGDGTPTGEEEAPLKSEDEKDDGASHSETAKGDDADGGATKTEAAAKVDPGGDTTGEKGAGKPQPEASKRPAGVKNDTKKAETKPTEIVLKLKMEKAGWVGPTKTEVQKLKRDEFEMRNQDALIQKTNGARDDLEGLMYTSESGFREGGKVFDFTTPDVVAQVSKQIEEIQEWLYNDGFDATFEEYDSRVEALKELTSPATTRYGEFLKFDTACEDVQAQIKKTKSKFDDNDDKSVEIHVHGKAVTLNFTDESIEVIFNTCKELGSVIADKRAEKAKASKLETPTTFSAKDINDLSARLETVWDNEVKKALARITPETSSPQASENQKKSTYLLLCLALFSVCWVGIGVFGLHTVRNLESCTMTYSRPSYIPVDAVNIVPPQDFHRCRGNHTCEGHLLSRSEEPFLPSGLAAPVSEAAGGSEETAAGGSEEASSEEAAVAPPPPTTSTIATRHEVKLGRLSLKYGLYRVHSGLVDNMVKSKKAKANIKANGPSEPDVGPYKLHQARGVPVLFLPGHLGSHLQARSLASHAAAQTAQGRKPLDIFSCDFGGEASALSGLALYDQAEWTNMAINTILQMYPPELRVDDADISPVSIILVGHSFGGIVARLALALDSHTHLGLAGRVTEIVSLASPHHYPPVMLDRGVVGVYDTLASFSKRGTSLQKLKHMEKRLDMKAMKSIQDAERLDTEPTTAAAPLNQSQTPPTKTCSADSEDGEDPDVDCVETHVEVEDKDGDDVPEVAEDYDGEEFANNKTVGSERVIANLVAVNVMGGHRDIHVRAPSGLLKHFVHPSRGFSVLTSTLAAAQPVSADHLSILWCYEVIEHVAEAIVMLAESKEVPRGEQPLGTADSVQLRLAVLGKGLQKDPQYDPFSHNDYRRQLQDDRTQLEALLPVSTVTATAMLSLSDYFARIALPLMELIAILMIIVPIYEWFFEIRGTAGEAPSCWHTISPMVHMRVPVDIVRYACTNCVEPACRLLNAAFGLVNLDARFKPVHDWMLGNSVTLMAGLFVVLEVSMAWFANVDVVNFEQLLTVTAYYCVCVTNMCVVLALEDGAARVWTRLTALCGSMPFPSPSRCAWMWRGGAVAAALVAWVLPHVGFLAASSLDFGGGDGASFVDILLGSCAVLMDVCVVRSYCTDIFC